MPENLEKRRDASKRRYAADPDRYRDVSKTWRQRNPEKAKEVSKRWREKNPEKMRANNRRWAAANRDKIREKARAFALANPEKIRERNKRRYALNKESLREKNRQWRLANADKIKAARARRYAEQRSKIIAQDVERRRANPLRELFNGARLRARKADLAFTISIDDLVLPADMKCPILRIPLVSGAGMKTMQPGSMTLDRIDNRFGYIKGNIQIISWRANCIKRDASFEELIAIGRYARKAQQTVILLPPAP